MEISLGDSVTIGAGNGRMNFTVVGIGLHQTIFTTQKTEIYSPLSQVPLRQGTSHQRALERLANMSSGSSNLLLIDILGTPDYNLPSTDEDDGPELTLITQAMDEIISN